MVHCSNASKGQMGFFSSFKGLKLLKPCNKCKRMSFWEKLLITSMTYWLLSSRILTQTHYSSLPVPQTTYNVSPNRVSFRTVHNTLHNKFKFNNLSLCIYFSIFWSHFNLFIYFNMGAFISGWTKRAANTEYSNEDLHIAVKIVNLAKRKAVAPWWWERVGYVKTQLSSILIITLTTNFFGHCEPPSCHKYIDIFLWPTNVPTVAEIYRRQHNK